MIRGKELPMPATPAISPVVPAPAESLSLRGKISHFLRAALLAVSEAIVEVLAGLKWRHSRNGQGRPNRARGAGSTKPEPLPAGDNLPPVAKVLDVDVERLAWERNWLQQSVNALSGQVQQL